MKKIYTTIALLAIIASASANRIEATANGKWNQPQTWNLNRIPTHGDSIVIRAGITVTIDNNNNLNNTVTAVYGALALTNGKLNFNTLSIVEIYPGGSITGSGNNDQIKIGNVFKYRGSQGVISGPLMASVTTGIAPNGFMAFEILPVRFNAISVSASGNQVIVGWSTSQEINNSHFEVERSLNGQQWSKIALVAGQTNSNQVQQYQYRDSKVSASVVYYRIRQVDINGKAQYSDVKTLRAQSAAKATIYASAKRVTVSFSEEVKESFVVRIVNMNGHVVAQQTFNQSFKTTLSVPQAQAGIYTVQVVSNNWNEAKKIVL